MVVLVKTTTSLKNERVRSVSREGNGGGDEDNHLPRKRAYMLGFEGGGWWWMLLVGVGWWWWLWQNTTLENERMCSFSRVVDGGGCHVTSGEKDKKIKRGRTLRPPLLPLPSSWWWHLQLQVVSPSPLSSVHLQLQVLSSSPSSFVDACSCRWCHRHCPFAPAVAGVVAVVVRWHRHGGGGERGVGEE